MLQYASDAVNSTSFFASPGGVITLVLLTALTGGFVTFVFKAVPEWRRGMREQTTLLRDLQRTISPEDRPGVVQRLESLEKFAAVMRDRLHREEGHQ